MLIALWLLLAVCVAAPTSTSLGPEPTPSTIIDILSSQAQFSYFLRVLQRRGMVPAINRLQNATLLAPVNSAFAAHSLDDWDNNELLRYVVGQKFRVGYMGRQSAVFDTLYSVHNRSVPVVVSPDFAQQQYVVDHTAAIVEADIYAKHQWSFIQAIDQLLPPKPSVCDVLMSNTTVNGHSISFVHKMFVSLFSEVHLEKKKRPALPRTCAEFLQDAGTVLIPTDEYIAASMPNMTERYYSALYHSLSGRRFSTTHKAAMLIKRDIHDLLRYLVLPQMVSGGNLSRKAYPSLHQKTAYRISAQDAADGIVVNKKLASAASGSNVILSDGIMHLFEPSHSNFFEALGAPLVDLTPKKALIALHFSTLVSELEFRDLDYLIDGSTTNQTVFLAVSQRDDFTAEAVDAPFTASSFSSTQNLLYQFAKQRVDVEDIVRHKNATFYKLVESQLCSKKRIGGCFRLKISSSYDHQHRDLESRLNDDLKVVSGPLDLGYKSLAYVVDEEVDTPSNFKHTLGELISNGGVDRHLEHIQIDQAECLRTIQYLSDSKLLSLDENTAGYSVFLPCGIASAVSPSSKHKGPWKSLGLLMNFLEQNPKILKNVLKGLFVKGMVYSDFGLDGGRQSYISESLRGDKVNITNAYYDGSFNHLLRLNKTAISLPLNSDLFFSQGVVHIVSDVMLPENFEVSLVELVQAAEPEDLKTSFLKLLSFFPHIYKTLGLDGKSDPEYSLLIPTSESLASFNATADWSQVIEFLQLHIIPNTELDAMFGCMDISAGHGNISDSYEVRSNHSDTAYECYTNANNGKNYLQVSKRNRNGEVQATHKVKIVSHGCTSPWADHEGDRSCVFLIDRPINPKWLHDTDKGFLHIHLGFVSVGIGVILGLTLFCGIIMALMFSLSGSRTKSKREPEFTGSIFETPGPSFMRVTSDEDPSGNYDGGYETDDDMYLERERLLPTDDTRRMRSYGSTAKTTAPMQIQSSKLDRNRNLPTVG